jgi:predicted exporter
MSGSFFGLLFVFALVIWGLVMAATAVATLFAGAGWRRMLNLLLAEVLAVAVVIAGYVAAVVLF